MVALLPDLLKFIDMEAQQIILDAFIVAMLMQAINAIFSEGMIFSVPGAWLERNAHFAWKMLMGCPVCMCPWYGAVMILVMHVTLWAAVSIGVAMGINWVISIMQPIEPDAPLTQQEIYEQNTTTGL